MIRMCPEKIVHEFGSEDAASRIHEWRIIPLCLLKTNEKWYKGPELKHKTPKSGEGNIVSSIDGPFFSVLTNNTRDLGDVMQPLQHQYSWFMRFGKVSFEILGLVLPGYLVARSVLYSVTNGLTITVGEVAELILTAFYIGFAFIFTAYFLAGFESDEEGLHIQFLWKRLVVPWEDVIVVKPLFNLRFLKNVFVIRTRSFTQFHRLYGLLYSFSPHPSLIYSRQISNYDALYHRLKVAVSSNRKISH